MAYMPPRGGTRGGKDQFEWDDVKADKHRENYLGHSVMAPVGRWQKGKDLSWYNKKSKVIGQKELLEAEIAAVKKAEEDAMAVALGLKPKTLGSGSVSKQELAEACRRQSVEEKEEEGQEERIKGLGYMNRRLSHLHSNQAAPTGAAMFESHPVHEAESRAERVNKSKSPNPAAATTAGLPPTKPTKKSELLKQALEAYQRSKEKKKKRKKDRSKRKHKMERSSRKRHGSSTSDSEEEADRLQRKRRSGRSSSSDASGEENDRRRKKRKTKHVTSSNSEERSGSRTREKKKKRREGKSDRDRGGEKKRKKKRKDGDREEPGSGSDDSGAVSHKRHRHGRDEKNARTQQSTRHRHDSSSD